VVQFKWKLRGTVFSDPVLYNNATDVLCCGGLISPIHRIHHLCDSNLESTQLAQDHTVNEQAEHFILPSPNGKSLFLCYIKHSPFTSVSCASIINFGAHLLR
jgi:hypothetical protein